MRRHTYYGEVCGAGLTRQSIVLLQRLKLIIRADGTISEFTVDIYQNETAFDVGSKLITDQRHEIGDVSIAVCALRVGASLEPGKFKFLEQTHRARTRCT